MRGSQARSSSTHSRPSSSVGLGSAAAKRSASPAPTPAKRSSDSYGTTASSSSSSGLRRPSVTGGGVGGPAAAAASTSLRAALANTANPSQFGTRTAGMSAVRAAGTGPAQPVRAYAPVPAASAQNGTATSAQSALAALNAAHRHSSLNADATQHQHQPSHARAPSVERSAAYASSSASSLSNDRPVPLSRNGSTNSLLHDAERMRAQQTAAGALAQRPAAEQPRAAAPAQPYSYAPAPYASSSAAPSTLPAGYSSPQRHDSPYSSHSTSPYSPAQRRLSVHAPASAASVPSVPPSSASLYPFSAAYAAANAAHSRAASITNHLVASAAASASPSPAAVPSHSSIGGYSPIAPPRGLSQLTSNYSAGQSSAALTGGLSTPASRGYVSRGYDSSRDDLDRALNDSDDEDDELERRMAHSRQVSHSRASAGDTVPAAAAPLARGSNGSGSNGGGSSGGRMRSLVGLGNLGNTCFLNSTLQCLLSTPHFLPYFTRGAYAKDINPKGSRSRGELAKAFGSLAQRMERAADHSVDRPSAVKAAVSMVDSKFAGYGQHDSHEFGRVLLSALHDELNRVVVKPPYVEIVDAPTDSDATKADRWWANYTARNDSIVTDCFSGQLQSSLVCLTCKKSSEAFDPFMDLSLPIPKTKGGGGGGGSGGGMSSALSRMSLFSSGSSSSGSSGGSAVSRCTLMDCFSEFLTEEVLLGHEQVYCRSCKTHRDQSKRLRVYRWPRILVLHLKRFSYGLSAYSGRSKINTDVDFPFEMDCRALQTNAAVTGQPPAMSVTRSHTQHTRYAPRRVRCAAVVACL